MKRTSGHAQHAAELDELGDIDAVVALFALGDKALRASQSVSDLALGQARRFGGGVQLR